MQTSYFTPEQLRDIADAKEAEKQGKPVQFRHTEDHEWEVLIHPSNWSNGTFYRPAPVPKTRPWSGPADVPSPVCWLSYCTNPEAFQIITSMNDFGIIIQLGDSKCPVLRLVEWSVIATNWRYSTDRLNWQPCVVTEPQP